MSDRDNSNPNDLPDWLKDSNPEGESESNDQGSSQSAFIK